MNLYLIAPASGRIGADSPDLEQALFPPLSLMQVAGITPDGVDIEFCDSSLDKIDYDIDADLVGLTANTSQAPAAYEIADEFSGRGISTVMGGMHASAMPEEALEHVDAVVIGEAEGIWPDVVAQASEGKMGGIYQNDELPDLAGLPHPRRDLIDPDAYIAGATMQATRGCPHDCDFCAVSTFFGRKQRLRPVDDVMDEINSIDADRVLLLDDNIMGKPSYAKKLFNRLMDADVTWLSQASTVMLKKAELIKQAASAGCEGLFVGLESIMPENLQDVGKGFNAVDKYRELVDTLHDNGIAIIGSFMFGLDNDDESVFERTAKFTEKAGIDFGQFSIVTPLPGTALYDRLKADGRIIERDWSKYDGSHVTFEPANMSPEALEDGLRWIYDRFYSWYSIVRRTARNIKPVVWALNEQYRRRVKSWLKRTESAEAPDTG